MKLTTREIDMLLEMLDHSPVPASPRRREMLALKHSVTGKLLAEASDDPPKAKDAKPPAPEPSP